MSDPVPLSFLPGVCKVNSEYSDTMQGGVVSGREAVGRFTDMDKTRFNAYFPEKLGGWAKASTDVMIGVPRGIKDWRDFNQNVYAAIGTHKKLYYYSAATIDPFNDITPWRAITTGTFTNKLNTTNGSNFVTVNHASHGQQIDDYVILEAASAVGGLTIDGVYFVETVVDANNYTIDAGSAATSTASNGGGVTAYTYYRFTLTNPFATVSGSAIVTVTHTAHGAQPGDYVTFAGASAVGGLTIDGEYLIIDTDANTYTINAGSNASSTATGGSTVTVKYDIFSGLEDSAIAYGYGTGTYGTNGYGTTGTTGILLSARTWTLQEYGRQLLSNPSGGSIYVYDPTIGGRSYPLFNAPETCLAMIVTPEGFVIAMGTDDNLMQIKWPDQIDYTDWTSLPTNTANEGRTLRKGSYLVNGIATRDGVSLIFSNTSCYNFNYIGDNSIYASPIAGMKCGLIGPLAVTAIAGEAFWMGYNEFWQWNGSVLPLPSDDIRDYVYDDINLDQAAKFVAGSNIAKKEVWFFYCSSLATEIDRYVIYHLDQNCWSLGTMERTCWLDKELFSFTMGTDASGYLYNHESGVDADGSAMDSYIEYSPIDIARGKVLQDVFAFIPDFKRQSGSITVSPLGKDRSQDSDTVYGPYEMNGETLIGIRVSGRLFGYKIRSNAVGGDWRAGIHAVEIQPAGARR